jgi:hypothetical protein
MFVVYYESMKRKLKIKPIYECRCDGRLQTKRFTRLSHSDTHWVGRGTGTPKDKDEVNKLVRGFEDNTSGPLSITLQKLLTLFGNLKKKRLKKKCDRRPGLDSSDKSLRDVFYCVS